MHADTDDVTPDDVVVQGCHNHHLLTYIILTNHDLTKKPCDSLSLIIKKGKFSNLSEKRVFCGTIFSENRSPVFGPWTKIYIILQNKRRRWLGAPPSPTDNF